MEKNGRKLYFFLSLIFLALWSVVRGAVSPYCPQAETKDIKASLVGHAHIDLSWLWLWEETVHEVAPQTFLNVLQQMEKLPGLTFAQSQAAIYEAIEKYYPELFQAIKKKIEAGTWIPVGGMWVEPDLNLPDGESLARQLLYGKRYFLEKFGYDAKVGWNPDSFGHSGQLPQILKKAGLDYYVFERCAPEKMPIFWWQGLDGSSILAYVPPGWYLVDLKKGIKNLLVGASRATELKDFLLLYGEGDHGGGPRDSDIETILKWRDDPSAPRFELVNPEFYFQKITNLNLKLPVFKGELNFTFPGCYTTQVEVKKLNRQLENLLLEAEKFSSLALLMGCRDYYPERDIDEAWKIALRHQFHDILDGSSIGPVYEEVKKYYLQAKARAERAFNFSLETLASKIDTRGEGWPLVVFNSLPWERSEPVLASLSLPFPVETIALKDNEGREVPCQLLQVKEEAGEWRAQLLFIARNVPSFGFKVYRIFLNQASAPVENPLKVTTSTLENEFFRLTFDPRRGWWQSLYDKKHNREILAAPGNVLEAIQDEPETMSAWELKLKEIRGRIGEEGARMKVLEEGPVRATIRVEAPFQHSNFIQDIQLYAGLPRIDVRVWLNWQERNIMVKATFPLAMKNPVATFEIPFGAIQRPALGNEVPALKWIDLSESSGSFGVSLLNDSRYGFDVRDNVMRLSLIRGATYPDPEADRGLHELAYSLYPHAGSWKEALSFQRGLEFNNPLRAIQTMVHPGSLGPNHSFLRISPENVIITALKKKSGYKERGFILRLVEMIGQETSVKLELPKELEIWETDLIERPLKRISSGEPFLSLKIKPYEIKTLLLFQ